MTIEKRRVEFGDFQTPFDLAFSVATFLKTLDVRPNAVVEPTCGLGTFVKAARQVFPSASVYALDVNPEYIGTLRADYKTQPASVHLQVQDFFENDWKSFFASLRGNILILGNPPWVTNSSIGTLGGKNLPKKSNFQNRNGFAAKTGKANFDISEWMLIKLLESLGNRPGCVAMLCKTSTARKVLKHCWVNRLTVGGASLHLIDAQQHFSVSVDACLFIGHTGLGDSRPRATVYRGLSLETPLNVFGLQGRDLVGNIDEFLALKELDGLSYYTWRSGVKHDAARVMEFVIKSGLCYNGLGETVEIDTDFLYPLLKSSDLANGTLNPTRFVLLTQRKPNDDTSYIQISAPNTWQYLENHAEILDTRRSIIYQNRPRFSVFGIGDYTFSAWKVAVSGLYKSLKFQVLRPCNGKPVVVDDTCYFVPCQTEREAQFVADLLNSELCQRFLRSLVFFDSKRPLTIDVLSRVDLKRVAEGLGLETQARGILIDSTHFEGQQTQMVYEGREPYGARSLAEGKTAGSRNTKYRTRNSRR